MIACLDVLVERHSRISGCLVTRPLLEQVGIYQSVDQPKVERLVGCQRSGIDCGQDIFLRHVTRLTDLRGDLDPDIIEERVYRLPLIRREIVPCDKVRGGLVVSGTFDLCHDPEFVKSALVEGDFCKKTRYRKRVKFLNRNPVGHGSQVIRAGPRQRCEVCDHGFAVLSDLRELFS